MALFDAFDFGHLIDNVAGDVLILHFLTDNRQPTTDNPMEPTKHTIYGFIPPYGATLVLHTNNIAELRFERTKAAEILKWFEDRTNEFRSQLTFHMQGPVMLGAEPVVQVPTGPTAVSAVGAALAPAQISQGKTLPLGTLLSRDQVQQLMQRFPKLKLEGETLYKACVELGFVKQDVGDQQSAIGQNEEPVPSLPLESTVAFDLTPTSRVDLEKEQQRIFQEAVDAAVAKALQAREENKPQEGHVESVVVIPASASSTALPDEPRTIE